MNILYNNMERYLGRHWLSKAETNWLNLHSLISQISRISVDFNQFFLFLLNSTHPPTDRIYYVQIIMVKEFTN